MQQLSERECKVLAATVEDYIRTALPVASARVKDVFRLPVSPATIRNTMATLEHQGYLSHPHTSAGKIPTDKGYRTYVNDLMVVEAFNTALAAQVYRELEEISGSLDQHLRIIAHIIAQLTGSVGITVQPVNPNAVLVGIRLVPVSHHRVLFVLELDGGRLRTVATEIEKDITDTQLLTVEEILRERLCGLTLNDIQADIGSRLQGTIADEMGITTVIIDHTQELFDQSGEGVLHTYGLHQILDTPEFYDQTRVVNLAELVEDEGELRALILKMAPEDTIRVTIGKEHQEEQLASFATIACSFSLGQSTAAMAVLAPTRVNYPQVIALLNFLKETVSN